MSPAPGVVPPFPEDVLPFAVIVNMGCVVDKDRCFPGFAGRMRLAVPLKGGRASARAGLQSRHAGTVYPALQQLEHQALIQSGRQGGKPVYRLHAGRKHREGDPGGVRRIWERAGRARAALRSARRELDAL